MTGKPLPKWKCKEIAADVTRLLKLTPGLHWTQVRDFHSPPLFPRDDVFAHRYDDYLRPLIKRALERELRQHHFRLP